MNGLVNRKTKGRLAPSPTGAQHLGNARTYLLAWLDAKSRQGEMVLRIEDIDTGRLKPGASEQIIEDLEWLGLVWDEGPVFQSSRILYYREALDRLKSMELVYPCQCSRADILLAASAPHAGEEICYPGTCAKFRVADAARMKKPVAWRARFDEAPAFIDRVTGAYYKQPPEIGGDFVVWRNDDTPAYQLAAVIDDAMMEITDVIRGDDLLSSTPKQIWLYEKLDQVSPIWAHVPLVVDENGKRFAKRDGDVQIRQLRERGVSPKAIVGWLGWSAGLLPEPMLATPRDLIKEFTIDKIPKEQLKITQLELLEIQRLGQIVL